MNFLLFISALFAISHWTTGMEVEVELERSSILHVWIRARNENQEKFKFVKPAQLFLSTLDGTHKFELLSTEVSRWFDYHEVVFDKPERRTKKEVHLKNLLHEKRSSFKLIWSEQDTEISYVYAFEKAKVKHDGIRPAYIREEARQNQALNEHSFHLRNPLGWANEPNGITRTNDGLYHVFYQHVIHECKRFVDADEGNILMNGGQHWGHAVSKDLANWVHMPIFLLSKFNIIENQHYSHWVEQWFSGSVMPEGEEGLRAFVTDFHLGREPEEVWQKEFRSADGISHSIEKTLLDKYPKEMDYNGKMLNLELRFNFRDPNVFKSNGHWYMTLGARDTTGHGGVIALFKTETDSIDSKWLPRDILHTDNRDDFESIECPGIFPLGDKEDPTLFALLYGREWGKKQNLHRSRDTIIQVGRFKDEKFEKIAEQTLDFAFGSYGHQGFFESQDGEAIMMGWLAWWDNWNFKDRFYSSETLPRVVKVGRDEHGNVNGVLVGPHPNVLKALKGEQIEGIQKKGNLVFFVPNTKIENDKTEGTAKPERTVKPLIAYAKVQIDQVQIQKGQQATIKFTHPEYQKLELVVSHEGIELKKRLWRLDGTAQEKRRLLAKRAQPDIIHVFVDIDSLEIYGESHKDNGTPRWTATARLAGNGAVFVHSMEVVKSGAVVGVEVFAMKRSNVKGYFVPNKEVLEAENAAFGNGVKHVEANGMKSEEYKKEVDWMQDAFNVIGEE